MTWRSFQDRDWVAAKTELRSYQFSYKPPPLIIALSFCYYKYINNKYVLQIDTWYARVAYMKKSSTIFLQVVLVLMGIGALTLMLWLPLTEGRATNLDLFSIYSDPFIIYGYIASIPFFIALYQVFKLLKYIRQNKVFTLSSVKAFRNIKYCAIILSILIVMAGLYIRIFHATDDDPAGFLAICIVTTFISIVVATVAAVFERTTQNAVDIKSENDLVV